jgi:hypothetical protein
MAVVSQVDAPGHARHRAHSLITREEAITNLRPHWK